MGGPVNSRPQRPGEELWQRLQGGGEAEDTSREPAAGEAPAGPADSTWLRQKRTRCSLCPSRPPGQSAWVPVVQPRGVNRAELQAYPAPPTAVPGHRGPFLQPVTVW